MDICSYCDGEGENMDMASCTECDGTGVLDEEVTKECWYCYGSGKDEIDEMGVCRICDGKGLV